jgi:hypothetical protein
MAAGTSRCERPRAHGDGLVPGRKGFGNIAAFHVLSVTHSQNKRRVALLTSSWLKLSWEPPGAGDVGLCQSRGDRAWRSGLVRLAMRRPCHKGPSSDPWNLEN